MVKKTSTNIKDTNRTTPHVMKVVPHDFELWRSIRVLSFRRRSKLLATASWASFNTLIHIPFVNNDLGSVVHDLSCGLPGHLFQADRRKLDCLIWAEQPFCPSRWWVLLASVDDVARHARSELSLLHGHAWMMKTGIVCDGKKVQYLIWSST